MANHQALTQTIWGKTCAGPSRIVPPIQLRQYKRPGHVATARLMWQSMEKNGFSETRTVRFRVKHLQQNGRCRQNLPVVRGRTTPVKQGKVERCCSWFMRNRVEGNPSVVSVEARGMQGRHCSCDWPANATTTGTTIPPPPAAAKYYYSSSTKRSSRVLK